MGKKLFRFTNEAAKRPEKKAEAWGDPLAQESAAPTETADRMRALMTRDFAPDQLTVLRELTGNEGAARYEDKVVAVNEVIAPAFDMLKVISEQTGLRLVDLKRMPRADLRLRSLISPEWAKTLRVVPVEEREDGVLVIAIADPSNPTISDDLRLMLARDVETVIADESEINERIESYYGMGGETISDILEKNAADEGGVADENVLESGEGKAIALDDLEKMANDGPIVKLVNLLLLRAIQERASDIHVEPFPTFIRLRYRVDGVLREIPAPPRSQLLAIISRIKVMAGMNISESRLPQDGRIKLSADNREIDMRCSTAPTVHGEAIVMRVLDKNMAMIGISKIGMMPEVLDQFKKLIKRPNGVVLVTGPTGSGKTTTLYAAMAEVRDPGEKLITTEDPVEYELEGIQQVNINESVGLTFGRCLRAILRQDPDTVLVGEIRDVDTAQIAVQAALTGHLVFSTLHTNSAAATVTRLLDMGVEPFLITSALQGVIGQRLVRTICQACKRPYDPSDEELEGFGVSRAEIQEQGITFFHGEGCSECSHSGYHGRMGIYELLEVNEEMREAILERATTDELQELALRHGMVTMRQDGWVKACMGLTTLAEIARQTPREDTAALPSAEEVQSQTPPQLAEEQPTALPAQPAGQLPDAQQGVDLNTEAAMPVRKAGDAAPTH